MRIDGGVVYDRVGGGWEDGGIVLPNSVYAVIAVGKESLAGGILCLGGWKGECGGAFADGGDVIVEKGIKGFW